MALLPHAQRWRALAVLLAWLLFPSWSGALQTATGHAELRPQMDDARKEYEESLKTFRELARKDPETYLPDVAMTLNNLGILDSAQDRMKEARKEYEESLKIYRKLAQKDPEAYLPNVAATLNNLGVLDRDKNRMEEALKTYGELAQKDPETYLPYVAITRNNLGNLNSDP
jgi:tetratricopeptide (TPR) repeat protein